MLSAGVFCDSYHVCLASNFLVVIRYAAGVTSAVHVYLHVTRVPCTKMPVHWLSPCSEPLLDSVQLCMLQINRILALEEQEIKKFASLCCDDCYTTALHVMQSLYMGSYVHEGTIVVFSSRQLVWGAKKWCIWFLILFLKLPKSQIPPLFNI